MRRCIPYLLPFMLTPTPALAAASLIRAEPQSIECFYPRDNQRPEQGILCSVRLHLRASKGINLWMHRTQDVPPAPLVGTDAHGNIMAGSFREWETCYEASDNCGIIVFDFYARPQGEWLAFETELEIPITRGTEEQASAAFNMTEATTLTIAGKEFRISPDTEAGDAEHPVLEMEYKASPDIADIGFLDDKGRKITASITDGSYDEGKGSRRAIYILDYKKDKAKISIHLYKPREIIRVPIHFKISIGARIDESK